MACGDLIRSSVLDCTNILQGGVGGDSRLVLILKKDIDAYTADGNDIVTAITLAAGKSGYSFDGIRQSLKPKFEIAKNENGQTVYKHVAEFFYFEYNQIAKNNLRQMGNGRYVAIYENSKQDIDAFEILGLDVGLEVTEGGRAPQENGGAMRIMLSSPEKEFEVKPPRTLAGATYVATKALVDGYLFLPTIGAGGLSITTYPAITPTAITITGTNFFGGGVNNGVLKVQIVNNDTGSVINVLTALTVTATTIACSLPATGEGAGKSYKVRVTTIKGVVLSSQNVITT
jgi:hypothetical protein